MAVKHFNVERNDWSRKREGRRGCEDVSLVIFLCRIGGSHRASEIYYGSRKTRGGPHKASLSRTFPPPFTPPLHTAAYAYSILTACAFSPSTRYYPILRDATDPIARLTQIGFKKACQHAFSSALQRLSLA